MILSKIKLFGLLALSYSLIACGQTQASTAPNAIPSAIAQTTVAPKPTETPAVVAKSPEPQLSAMASTETATKTKQFVDCDNDGKADDEWIDVSGTKTCSRNAKNPDESLAEIEPATFTNEEIAESVHKQFENYANQPCDRQSKDEKSTRYTVCSVERVTGKPRIISASSSLIEAGDGIGYWFTEEGKVAAIRFFHSDELFMFDIDGKLKVELISAQKVMVNGEEQFQKRSVRTKFDQATRDRLEKLAKGGGKEILSKFK